MADNFRNLVHVLSRYKVATIANILGLAFAFAAFMVVVMHVKHEYGFDKNIEGREYIFQVENLRGDGVWESNWARPQIERFVAHTPYIESAAIYNGISYSSHRFGFSVSPDQGSPVYMAGIDRIRPDFLDVFPFEMVHGSADNLKRYGMVLVPESLAKNLYGDQDPVGKPLYPSEFRGLSRRTDDGKEVFTVGGLEISFHDGIGGIYRDFPENSRLKNVLYGLIPEDEQMDDWYTGSYYCYVKLTSPEMADEIASAYMAENEADLNYHFDIHDIRLRPIDELYFSRAIRADGAPHGNRLATDMLLMIGILIIVIALINYVNFSVALAPARIKAINTRKVLGCSQTTLRYNLITESLGISAVALLLAFMLILLLQNGELLTEMMGHPISLADNWPVVILTGVLALAAGIVAGLYPAFYMTSFPPAMAINGSYALTGRAKATRKALIGFQYVISIALMIGAIFISLQNRYISKSELGFDKEQVVEVRVSFGTAVSSNRLIRELALRHPDVLDAASSHTKFVTDESQALIGYFHNGEHGYMAWRGASPTFLDVLGIEIIAGRNFRPSDEERGDDKAVVIINETAARELLSRMPGQPADLDLLIGTPILDDGTPVEIVGVSRDFHHQSLYRQITPYAFWVSAENRYRRNMPEVFTYFKIAPGDPSPALAHIRSVVDQVDPGYPTQIRFLDETMERLYQKSHKEGLMVTVFSLLAILISLVGVFGLVIFEAQRREKEIAVRKVFGAGIDQILVMFNTGFIKIVGVCFLVAAPLAWYAVGKWLQNFAYKTPMHIWVFLVALVTISALTAATVTFQSYRTATENPARKLRG